MGRSDQLLLSAVLGLVLGCAGGRGSPSAAPQPALPKSSVSNRVSCLRDAVRASDKACTLRANKGVYQQTCTAGAWHDTDHCLCSGSVHFGSAELEREIAKALGSQPPVLANRAAQLRQLRVRGAGIDSLEGLECAPLLEDLDLGKNRISDLGPLAELGQLRKLELYHNAISVLAPLAKLTSLVALSLPQNEIGDIAPLAPLTRLEQLSLFENHISDLTPLRQHVQLTSLELGSNCIGDLGPLAGLTKLEHLNVSFNAVVDAGPLSGMTAMQHLILAGNHVTNLAPISGLSSLRTLFVDSNGVHDISPLTKLSAFDLLVVQRNPIDCNAQASQIATLERTASARGARFVHDCTPKRRRAIALGLDRGFEVHIQTGDGEQVLSLPQTHSVGRCAK